MSLCKYQNLLGVPGQGIHSYRIFNIAIVDVVMTIVAGYFLSRAYKSSFVFTCVILFILGIVLHRLFCVRTTIDKLLFS